MKKYEILKNIRHAAASIKPAVPYLYGTVVVGLLGAVLFNLSTRNSGLVGAVWLLVTAIAMTAGAMVYFAVRKRWNKLSIKTIKGIIRSNGLRVVDEEEDTVFFRIPGSKPTYAAVFKKPQFFLRYPFYLSGDIRMARAAAYEVMDQRFMVKISIEQTNEPKKNLFANVAIETADQRTDLLRKNLLLYLQIVNSAAQLFLEKIECPASDPTAANRREGIYDPEYRWFPQLVKAVSNGRIALDALSDEEWLRKNLQQICGDAFSREWNAFRIKTINTYGCYKLFVYEFPEPREIPEARYGAVWIDTSTRHAEYYTLEYSLDNRWVLGCMTEEQHANYGSIDSPDLKRFILWILESNKEPECTLKRRDKDSEPVN